MTDATPKPCPFCGARATIERHTHVLPNGTEDELFYVECRTRSCGHRGMPWYPASAAIKAWNRRVAEATLGNTDLTDPQAVEALLHRLSESARRAWIEAASRYENPAHTFPLALIEWLQRWWKRDAAWRNEQRASLGADVAQLMRGVADMIEGPRE